MHEMRALRHRFLAAGHHDFRIAANNRLRRHLHRLHARAAHHIYCGGRFFNRNARGQRRLACRVLPHTGGEHIAHNHFIHRFGRHAGFIQQRFDGHCAQLRRAHAGQAA